MADRKYPTLEFVRQCLREEDGKLFWLVRPECHFPNAHACNAWNGRYAGVIAGNLKRDSNRDGVRCKIRVGTTTIVRSTIVWALKHGVWLAGLDHKNHNPLDDRIENLRPATSIQNAHNQGKKKTNTSGYKGVSRNRRTRSKPWEARIMINGKKKYLVAFNDPADAHAAYCRAADLLHGEFACHG